MKNHLETKKILKALAGAVIAALIFFITLPYIFIILGTMLEIPVFFSYTKAIAGIIMITAGITIFFYCSYLFIKEGKGTPAPFEPTNKLVKNRIYKYTRNPMYIGYMLIITGQFFLTGAVILIVYALLIFSFIYWYVIFIEEPKLEKKFGKKYKEYKKKVPRWLLY